MSVPTLLPRRPARLQPVHHANSQAPQVRAALPWLLVSLGLTMVTLIGQVPFWALGIFAGCVVWRQVLERRGRPLPSMAWRMAVFVPAATGVFLTYGSSPGAPGMLTLLTALLALKVLELNAARDLTFVALLGYFMILSAFFYNQALWLNLYLGVAVMLNTIGLIRCHGGGNTRPVWPTVRLALGMSLQAIPLVVFLFVIFPRFQGDFLRRLGGATTGLTGMNEHLEPGSFSTLVQSDQTAFRAQISEGDGSLPGFLYWRGLVLDTCNQGLLWTASPPQEMPRPPDAVSGKPPPTAVGKRIKQTVTLWPHGKKWLFALDRPVEAVPSSGLKPRLVSGSTLQSGSPVLSKVIYTVYSQLVRPDNAPPPALSESQRRFYTLQPDALSPRTLQLAADWRNKANKAHPTEDIVRSARHFFQDGGFTYTLNPGALPPKSALDSFLFRTRKGFCEHYAGAFATLMRAAGVPSRIVVGYLGGEFNGWSNYYTVRQSDAHAWAEVWIDGKGWQREDPTAVVAPERLSFSGNNFTGLSADGTSEQSRLEQLRRMEGQIGWRWLAHNALLAWDGVDQQWNLYVLGYDQDQQSSFMQQLGFGNIDWVGGTTVAMSGIFGLLALGTLAMRSFGRDYRATRDPAQRLYARFCERVNRAAEVQRAESEGPLDFAVRAKAALPDCAAQIAAVTESYIALRYAPAAGAGSENTLTALRRAVDGFRPVKAKT